MTNLSTKKSKSILNRHVKKTQTWINACRLSLKFLLRRLKSPNSTHTMPKLSNSLETYHAYQLLIHSNCLTMQCCSSNYTCSIILRLLFRTLWWTENLSRIWIRCTVRVAPRNNTPSSWITKQWWKNICDRSTSSIQSSFWSKTLSKAITLNFLIVKQIVTRAQKCSKDNGARLSLASKLTKW